MTSWQLRNNKCKRKCGKKRVPTKLALPPCAYACATNLASGICPCLKMPSFVAVKHSSTALSCGVSVALQLCVWERHLQARLVALDTTSQCHQNEAIFSCNCCCPYKNRMIDRLLSVMQCPVWAVACVPSVFSLSHTYSALFIHVSVAGHQPTAVSGKQEHLFGGVNVCNAQHVGCNIHHSSLRLATVETCIDQQHFTG